MKPEWRDHVGHKVFTDNMNNIKPLKDLPRVYDMLLPRRNGTTSFCAICTWYLFSQNSQKNENLLVYFPHLHFLTALSISFWFLLLLIWVWLEFFNNFFFFIFILMAKYYKIRKKNWNVDFIFCRYDALNSSILIS